MITNHRYDAGWPRDDSKGCVAEPPPFQGWPTLFCGKPEAEHALSEYPSQRPNREDVGVMHEPKPYTGDLDWSDLASPFVD